MAKKGKVKLVFECVDCQQKIRLTLHYGEKRIWNNTTSPTLQKLKAHEKHQVLISYEFERVVQ